MISLYHFTHSGLSARQINTLYVNVLYRLGLSPNTTSPDIAAKLLKRLILLHKPIYTLSSTGALLAAQLFREDLVNRQLTPALPSHLLNVLEILNCLPSHFLIRTSHHSSLLLQTQTH